MPLLCKFSILFSIFIDPDSSMKKHIYTAKSETSGPFNSRTG